MMWKIVLLSLLTAVLAAGSDAQGTAASFLLISPSAEANGMGETSVAIVTDDPAALIANPAQLGLQSRRNFIAFGRDQSDWLPMFSQSDLWYRAYALTTGINLKSVFGIEPEISVGIGYSQVFLNLGQFTVTQNDPTPLGTFNAYEASDQYTIAASIRSWVDASAGVTFKRIASSLATTIGPGPQPVGTTVDSYDYGLLVDVPLAGIIERLRDRPLELFPSVAPVADLSIGFSQNTMGDNTMATFSTPADPLPRYARIGIGLDAGFVYESNGTQWKPLAFRWTREANDLLVRSSVNPQGGVTWEYQNGLGDIDFFSEVIAGNTNAQTIRKTGWEFSFLDVISIRGGRFEEDQLRGNRRFSTSGFGIRSSGITNFLRAIDAPLLRNDIVNFLVSHIAFRYDHSDLMPDLAGSTLTGTRFDSFHLFLTN